MDAAIGAGTSSSGIKLGIHPAIDTGPNGADPGNWAKAALGDQVVAALDLPERPGLTEPWPHWAPQSLVEFWQDKGVAQPWRHQVDAANSLASRTNTVISTGTGSGKSIGYWLPALTEVQAGATVLYLAPTKALGADQRRSIAGAPRVVAATYDGDTPMESRDWVRSHANVLFSNPDMVHRKILRQHRTWRRFLRRLAVIVVDEAHYYRGVFGANTAQVLRRLHRIARIHGSEPTWALASATLPEPAAHAERLVGQDFHSVAASTAPQGRLSLVVADPQRLATEDEEAPSSFAAAVQVAATLHKQNKRTIVFLNSRKGVETMASAIKGATGSASDVAAYRGGLLPEERRAVETDLAEGRLLTVAATCALELGVDISGLDAVITCGWPGKRDRFLQQMGRAGRQRQPATAVLIAGDDPLDRYLVNNPDRILSDPLEDNHLNVQNPHVITPHLAAAMAEAPFVDGETPDTWFGAAADGIVAAMIRAKWVRQRPQGLFWTRNADAHNEADLRGAGQPPVTILDESTGVVVGSVDQGAALRHLHTGAIYLHAGATYLVAHLDLDRNVALVNRTAADYTTAAISHTNIDVLQVQEQRSQALGDLVRGSVRVTSTVLGFLTKSREGHVISKTPLDLPAQESVAESVWWTMPTLPDVGSDLPGTLHAAEHTAIGVLPGLATCDRWDLGGLSTAGHPDTGEPTIFVYEGYPGGTGISDHAFEIFPDWMAATHGVVVSCTCPDGCPSCVQSPKCGNGNDPLDKHGAIRLLAELQRH